MAELSEIILNLLHRAYDTVAADFNDEDVSGECSS